MKMALPVALALFASQAHATPTDSDCESAWTSSSASQSCGEDTSTHYFNMAVSPSVDTTRYDVTASNDECRVAVHCLRTDTTVSPVANEFFCDSDEVGSLHNCEGSLKVGGC